ncbi:polysaccharide biosynthesis protein [Ruficoccus amylovorans]|uniref:Polysaccharide biosynthesis protein n=1 Tax=Ruficoccus amylovorans TaxID=1804625 RepID=A0A842HHE7_9BACT|nr:nucleoside-diphosphate sugar epimerase/dehydratase [Ruficoccus amylovorans]MBC2594661.1 polysaccharide biosynthesis protein [Ruficoccus amylovorans]
MAKKINREGLVYAALIAFLCVAGFYFAYEIRWEFQVPSEPTNHQRLRVEIMLWLIPLEVVVLYAFGQFEVAAARFRSYDFFQLAMALGVTTLFLLYLWYVFGGKDCPSRGVIMINFMTTLLALTLFRGVLQYVRGDALGIDERSGFRNNRVAIYGAGFVCDSLIQELQSKRGFGMQPVTILDDNPAVIGHKYQGLRVFGGIETLSRAVARYDLDRLIIARPDISPSAIREVLLRTRRERLDTLIVPSPQELLYGQVRAEQLRPVELEDFLGRISLDTNAIEIHQLVSQNVVMVTGAGGSIGGELCRQIAAKNPSRILLVEQSEAALFVIEQELRSEGFGAILLPLLADISDHKRMEFLLDRYRPTIIFHSAAHKHVPMIELQPGEAIKNNTLATAQFARLASKYRCKRFVFISSDKAINPTSAMGASKRLAELYLQAFQTDPANETVFLAVRFGNVLGSSGSVVPIFKKQIREGGPVTVTHPDVTRYFMSIPEAVGLVLQTAILGVGGDIFVLDMGLPIKVVDVARQMIELSGFEPEVDIEIRFVGLRPGEKLFEELKHKGEEYMPTEHPRVQRYISKPGDLADLDAKLAELEGKVEHYDRNQIKQMLQRLVPEYSPYLD